MHWTRETGVEEAPNPKPRIGPASRLLAVAGLVLPLLLALIALSLDETRRNAPPSGQAAVQPR
jgi:hypothetical protein